MLSRITIATLATATVFVPSLHAQTLELFACENDILVEEVSAPHSNQHLGASIATGDVNGDGVTDLVLGGADHPTETGGLRRAVVFLGRLIGGEIDYGDDPELVIDGNGKSDLFALSVAVLPDFNGDGRDEIVVGAPNWPNEDVTGDGKIDNYGKVYLFLGPNIAASAPGVPAATVSWVGETDADATWTGTRKDHRFGYALDATDDFGTDGRPDLAIGAPGGEKSRPSYPGEVYIVSVEPFLILPLPANCVTVSYPGGQSMLCSTLLPAPTSNSSDRFGRSVAFMGHWTGTGGDELVVGAPQFTPDEHFLADVNSPNSSVGGGYVQIYTETLTGIQPALPQLLTAAAPQYAGGQGEAFGFAVGGGGDVEGSLPELYVGAPFYDTSTDNIVGRVFVYSGDVLATLTAPGSAAPSTALLYEQEGEDANGEFGSALATLGDLDGDGSDEILVGAGFLALTVTQVCGDDQGGPQTGAAYVVSYVAGQSELLIRIGGEDPRDHMGFALWGGELDASGAVDLVSAGMAYAGLLPETGRVYVFEGESLLAALNAAP